MTSNSFILNIVQYGYIIQFESEPFQSDFTPRPMSKETITVCMRKVKQFLSNGAIIQVQPSRDQFLSDIFPVIKKSLLDHRIILDLSELNLFVRKVSFKMDSLDYIMNMIRPGDYFISIDISDAYYAIAINASSMPYLTFIFLGLYYQFACLPQGLSSAPRIFTRVMKVVLSFLRTYGIRIAAWLDDLILAAASASLAASHTEQALYTLKALGFLPNYEKSILIPVQRIEHLGLVWDSVAYTVSVPDDKFRDVQKKCGVALSSVVSLRFLSSILGSIEYFRWGFPFAALHYRALQRFVNACLSRDFSYDYIVSVPPSAATDLRWWVDTEFLNPRSLVPFSPSITLYSDASLLGWGGWTSDGLESFGSWSTEERDLHINVLEMMAVLFLFRCFFASSHDCSIAVRSDNCTVVAYINHQGGPTSREVCDLALELWQFCVDRCIMVRASHIEGVRNVKADALSRRLARDHAYFLCQDIFDAVAVRLHFSLSTDCFASRLNAKLPAFFSRYADPQALDFDAFAVPWHDELYLFPPFPVIHRVISKFISDGVGHGLLVCPYWPSQSWFSSLLDLLIASPILLPPGAVVDEDHRIPKHSVLLAWPIGSSLRDRRGYRDRLPLAGSAAYKSLLYVNTSAPGAVFMAGFINGRVVTVQLL